MSKKFLTIISTILFFIFVITFIRLIHFQDLSDNLNSEITRLSSFDFKSFQENDLLRESLQFDGNNKEIDISIELDDGEINKKISLEKLLTQDYKLFFNFSDINCSSCISQETANIKALSDSIGSNKIILLADYRTQRSLILFKRANNLKNPIYNLNGSKLGIKVEDYNLPFYGLINSSGRINNIFIPDKARPILSKKYLEAISNFL